MVTALTAPMMSVNWSWTKRMPLSFAASIFSAPSTASRAMTTDAASFVRLGVGSDRARSCAGRTIRAPRTGCGQDNRRIGLREGCDGRPSLVILHKSERERDREADLRIGEAPTRQGLDPADPVGDRVAMDPECRGGLRQAGLIEERAQRRQPLTAHVRPALEQRLQEGPCLPLTFGKIVQIAQ